MAYSVLRTIGRGAQGTVDLCADARRQRKVVIKRIPMLALSDEERGAALGEVDLLRRLSHPNIVEYLESFEEDAALQIVMQYCDGGDLAGAIRERRRAGAPFPEAQVMDWFVQMVSAVSYLHGQGVLHRDLKTSNVFLTRGNVVKLGDFGIATVLDSTTDLAETVVGTPYYMSPEACQNRPYGYKSDVWALGCIIYEMCALQPAFKAGNLLRVVVLIVKEEPPPLPPPYSAGLRGLVAALLAKEPEGRPFVEQILDRPFVRDHAVRLIRSAGSTDPTDPMDPTDLMDPTDATESLESGTAPSPAPSSSASSASSASSTSSAPSTPLPAPVAAAAVPAEDPSEDACFTPDHTFTCYGGGSRGGVARRYSPPPVPPPSPPPPSLPSPPDERPITASGRYDIDKAIHAGFGAEAAYGRTGGVEGAFPPPERGARRRRRGSGASRTLSVATDALSCSSDGCASAAEPPPSPDDAAVVRRSIMLLAGGRPEGRDAALERREREHLLREQRAMDERRDGRRSGVERKRIALERRLGARLFRSVYAFLREEAAGGADGCAKARKARLLALVGGDETTYNACLAVDEYLYLETLLAHGP